MHILAKLQWFFSFVLSGRYTDRRYTAHYTHTVQYSTVHTHTQKVHYALHSVADTDELGI